MKNNNTIMPKEFSSIIHREGDPNIYLWADGRWYFYNPSQSPLGGGAMGTVYIGYSLDRKQKIVVKKVHDKYAELKPIRDRALLEASLAFRHPNLVEMIGACEYPNHVGPIFILSNFVNGCNIDKHVKQYLEFNPDREIVISREICNILDALEYLHLRGVIHRDIKPSNIMIENDKSAKLIDLGIAKMDMDDDSKKHTSSGFVGTYCYAAPEQILRSEYNETVIDATTDIYALGVTFYELLAGYNPFDSEIESEIIEKSLNMKLPKSKKISRRMLKVIRKATEKKQSRRFQTATEFKMALMDAMQPRKDVSKYVIAAISITVITLITLMFTL